MKTVLIKSLEIENFKGLKHFVADLSQGENRVLGENGTGKSRLHNAWQWLLLGSVKDFVTTKNGVASKDTVTVRAHIVVDGREYTICRQKPYGSDFVYWVDGLNVKFTRYKQALLEMFGLADYSQIELLSELGLVNTTLTTAQKRKLLISIAGADTELEKLADDAKYGAIKDYIDKGYSAVEIANTLRATRKQTKSAQDRLNYQIEIMNSQNAELVAKYDFDTLAMQIVRLENKLADLQMRNNQELENAETEQISRKLQELTRQLQVLTAEKSIRVVKASEKVTKANGDLIALESELEQKRQEWKTAVTKMEQFNPEQPQICPFCHSVMDGGSSDSREQAQKLVDWVESLQGEVIALQGELKKAKARKLGAISELHNANVDTAQETELKQGIIAQKTALEQAKSMFASKSLTDSINRTRNEILELQSKYAHKSILSDNNDRIAKCRQENVELADKLLEIMKTEQLVREYSQEQTKVLESKINAHFDNGVEWLISVQEEVDGDIVETEACDCMLNGVTYGAMSTGEKSVADIEVIKALQKLYGVQLPLWCEDAESITKDYEYGGQQIKLFATAGQKQLVIKKEKN